MPKAWLQCQGADLTRYSAQRQRKDSLAKAIPIGSTNDNNSPSVRDTIHQGQERADNGCIDLIRPAFPCSSSWYQPIQLIKKYDGGSILRCLHLRLSFTYQANELRSCHLETQRPLLSRLHHLKHPILLASVYTWQVSA